jgi:malonate transporter and related proteins
MILNSLFPVFALIVCGHLLKRFGLTDAAFLKTSDRLVYYVLFPILLFWKIGSAPSVFRIRFDYCLAALLAVFAIFVISSLYIKIFKVGQFQAGTFSQSCYRFNSYVGMAVILTALGEEAVRYFGILIGIVIPVINVLSVSILIWFSGQRVSPWKRFRITIRELVSNPLILACVAGMVYSRYVGSFPEFVDNTLHMFSLLTLPLALISIGGALTLTGLRRYVGLSTAACVFKLVLLPVVGYYVLQAMGIGGLPCRVTMVYFALPTSPAIFILSSQLNSDTHLASAVILLSTILSFFSLCVVLLL